ncbi:MAG: transglutaminase domain-containing protein [Spirochaetales bacterium]|nr:transglutaminase domain-containing protein [Spirochaetales bacterium]
MTLFLLLSVAAFSAFTLMDRRPPRLEELSRLLSDPGDRIDITGRRFGESRALSEVYFDDRQLNLSHLESWSDDTITILVPPFSNSALVTVETEHGKSNPLVLYNRDDFPSFSLEPFLPELPYIEFIDPSEGGCGTLVTIEGSNFGDNRRSSSILINGKKDNRLAFFDTPREKDFITLSSEDYVSWNMNRISFYIPERVESGFLYIKTDRGFSNPIYFDVTQRGDEEILGEEVRYQFLQSLLIDRVGAWEGNSLFLWMPQPSEEAHQQSVSLISESVEPFLTRGDRTLYRFDNLQSGDEFTLSRQFTVSLRDRRLIINPSVIPLSYDSSRELYKTYTASTEEYPLSNRTLKNRASYGAGGYKNPYSKARAIYQFLLARLSWQEQGVDGSPLAVIDGRKGNTDDYVRALISLYRSQGLPAREVRGVLIDEDREGVRPHCWVEIYLERVGWFPVDPALADGAWPMDGYGSDYFWGGVTDRHLAFSRGEEECGSLDDRTVRIKWDDHYSKQTVHEEKRGNLSYYRSRWELPEIVDVFGAVQEKNSSD